MDSYHFYFYLIHFFGKENILWINTYLASLSHLCHSFVLVYPLPEARGVGRKGTVS